MNQPNFISHAQVVPPVSTPRQGGLGLLSVLAIVVAVLAGALTGGLFLVDRLFTDKVAAAVKRLEEIQGKTQLASLERVQSLQDRIDIARAMLGEHVYASQAFEFVEKNLLETTQIHSFNFADGVVKMQMTTPNFTVFAQQLKHFRGLDEVIKTFSFDQPTLGEQGNVTFAVSITLKEDYLRTPPEASGVAEEEVDLTSRLPGEEEL